MNDEAPTDNTLIAAADGTVYPLSNSECVFRAKHNGEKHVMTAEVLKALDVCSYFRTFDDHIRAVQQALPDLAQREADVRRVLQALDSRGLLVSADELLEHGASEDTAPELAGVFIRSNGRDKALATLLESLAENERRFGNRYRYYIADDADESDAADACRRVVSAARDQGLDCHWLGRDWQKAFVDKLKAASDVEPDLIRWALDPDGGHDGFTGGRLCNIITLAAAGQPYLLLDDDMVCDARTRRADRIPRLRLDDEDWEIWFHADAAAADEWGERVDFDPLADAAAALGHPTGKALNRMDLQTETLAGLDQRKLFRALDAPVLGTVGGTYGDIASSQNIWMFNLTGESRERFWASREDYYRNLESRYITRVRETLALQSVSNFTATGHAGQWMLPPTLPFGRNEDALVATVSFCLYPDSYSLELPWAFGHHPQEERAWSSKPWDGPCNENLARFIGASALGNAQPVSGGDARARYAVLAGRIAGIAAEDDADLLARLDEFSLFVRSGIVSGLQSQLADESEVPVYWAADARRIIEVNGKAITTGNDVRLQDMPDDLDQDGVLGWVRERVGRYGELMAQWPRLWESARGLDGLPG